MSILFAVISPSTPRACAIGRQSAWAAAGDQRPASRPPGILAATHTARWFLLLLVMHFKACMHLRPLALGGRTPAPPRKTAARASSLPPWCAHGPQRCASTRNVLVWALSPESQAPSLPAS